MALLRFLVFVALIAVSVDGSRTINRRRRKVETAEDPHFENELRRVKRLGSGPYLNRVKRLRRMAVPMYADFDEGHFDPGLSRVKRHRRSPNPIMTMRNSYNNLKALARMKRVPYFREEFDSQRKKRNALNRHMKRAASKIDNRRKSLMAMRAHLTDVHRKKHRSTANLNHKRFHKSHRPHKSHRFNIPDNFRLRGRKHESAHRPRIGNKNTKKVKQHRLVAHGEAKKRELKEF
ncbi:hypothetical protein FSP39_014790 [Pinctada imbricata]|uniref:Uncharacterized protein n=1 Tax=Pinctada imbricata TaxID=66713 RepID=A0AA89C6K6_PINIB|nr:hypothetical protein FSP39_014790 [Pinctada imbricata]